MRTEGGYTKQSDWDAGRRRSGLGSRRVVWTSFGISIAVHAALIGLYPVYGTMDPANARLPFPDFASTPEGLQVLRLIELAQPADPERPEDPEEIEEIEPPVAAPAPLILEEEVGLDLTPPPPSGAELLRPRLTDERLWRPIDPSLTRLSLEQREELAIAGRLSDWYDSLAAAEAAESRLTDWTFTDRDGKRWGVSEGKLHLGDLTLPLPFSFGTPVGKREEVAERQWQWDEIMRQSARRDVEDSWKERQEAIRERRDRERTGVPPDTTRAGR